MNISAEAALIALALGLIIGYGVSAVLEIRRASIRNERIQEILRELQERNRHM